MDLEYKDRRAAAYSQTFSDEQRSIEPVKMTETVTKVRSDGEYVYESLDIKRLISTLEQNDRDIRMLKQEIKCLAGQFEYLYKNGKSGYDAKIDSIKADYPKPSN